MTKMAAMPIYGKNLKKLFLQNQKADDLETWYAWYTFPPLPNQHNQKNNWRILKSHPICDFQSNIYKL